MLLMAGAAGNVTVVKVVAIFPIVTVVIFGVSALVATVGCRSVTISPFETVPAAVVKPVPLISYSPLLTVIGSCVLMPLMVTLLDVTFVAPTLTLAFVSKLKVFGMASSTIVVVLSVPVTLPTVSVVVVVVLKLPAVVCVTVIISPLLTFASV